MVLSTAYKNRVLLLALISKVEEGAVCSWKDHTYGVPVGRKTGHALHIANLAAWYL